MNVTIYAADDDENIRSLMKTFLENEGYNVKVFSTGDDLYDEFKKSQCDLIVLDIMMPGSDGLTICNKIRKISKVPIIMLTAKDTDADYIAGITIGSDDYLTKPFRPTMLIIRVKALLRRIAMEREEKKNVQEEKDIEYGDLKYIPKKHTVLCNNIDLKLTETELRLFIYLLNHKEESVSKDELLDKIWGMDLEFESRVADETARRIRKKLKQLDSNVLIRTVWGYGYKLDIIDN